MEKISVIVPVYEPPIKNLKACLQSLAKQDYENYEVIVVNDGSSVDLAIACREFLADTDKFKVINQENKGVSAARNVGLTMASGTYICFCDADDYVSANFLSVMKHCMADVDLAICGVAGQKFPVISSTLDIKAFFASPHRYNKLQYTNFCCNKMFRKEIIRKEKIQFDESVKLGEDALFLAEYLPFCHRIRTIEKELYHYVPNEESGVYTYYPYFGDWEKRVIAWQWKRFTADSSDTADCQYMKYWAFCKIRQVLNYYERPGADAATRRQVFSELHKSEVYTYIYSYPFFSGNSFFRISDVMQLVLWKALGLENSTHIKKYLRGPFARPSNGHRLRQIENVNKRRLG